MTGLSNFTFLGLITLGFDTIILLLYLGSKFWPEFIICAIYFNPHDRSKKLFNLVSKLYQKKDAYFSFSTDIKWRRLLII